MLVFTGAHMVYYNINRILNSVFHLRTKEKKKETKETCILNLSLTAMSEIAGNLFLQIEFRQRSANGQKGHLSHSSRRQKKL